MDIQTIKDEAVMNVQKHLHNLNSINLNQKELASTCTEGFFKRPYSAHGFKIKAKENQIFTKTLYPKNKEDEKVIAFKEKVKVYDKTLSLFNNDIPIKKENLNKNKSKKRKVNNSMHYMLPTKKKEVKNKKIINNNDNSFEDIDNNENVPINDNFQNIKKMLTGDKMNTFIANINKKNNITKFYHGGKKPYRPNTATMLPYNNKRYLEDNKKNNSEYRLFNKKEITPNPNNKFNFFSQSFTKEPIYGKIFNPPKIENNINVNLSYTPSSKWNGRFRIKKYTFTMKENPNDVYNYDYKYDDLNSDSDNELPSTVFKSRKMPKYKKVEIEIRDKKTGKIIGGKEDKIFGGNIRRDNERYDKIINHPFLIKDDAVNF